MDDGGMYWAGVPEQRVIYNEGGDPKDGLRIAYYFEFSEDYPAEERAYVSFLVQGAVNVLRRSIRVCAADTTTLAWFTLSH